MPSDPHQVTVRVQALDGQWETLGADSHRTVVPESVQYSFNEQGPDTASFLLRRAPNRLYPDMTTWTPIEIWIGGKLVWDGRLKETPNTEGDDPQISVQGEGWQYHLDDDVYQPFYLHTRMAEWQDTRTVPTSWLYGSGGLSGWQAVGTVSTGSAPSITIGKGDVFRVDGALGIYLDCGAATTGARYAFADVTISNPSGHPLNLFVRGSASPAQRYFGDTAGLYGDATAAASPTTGIYGGDLGGAAWRWVTVFIYNPSGADYTVTNDITIAFNRISVADSHDQINGSTLASTITADFVVKDVLAHTTFLQDTSGVTAGTFNIPDFASSSYQSHREILAAANAYENYDLRVLLGRKMLFAPRATAPTYAIGEWAGTAFQDASANSGDDIYNRVVVQGTGPDGAPLSVERYSTDVSNTVYPVTTPSPLATSTSGSGSSPVITTNVSFSGTFLAHTRYRVRLTWGNAFGGTERTDILYFGNSNQIDGTLSQRNGSRNGVNFIDWTPTVDTPGASVILFGERTFFSGGIGTPALSLSDIALFVAGATMADRRGFRRTKILPVNMGITITSGARLGDLYLLAHQTTPFKGNLTAVGTRGVRKVIGGDEVHPSTIQPGALLRCLHRIDPDDGSWGRDGTIATVSYDHDSLTATVSLDENRGGFDALLSRLSIVVGGG